MKKRIQIAGSLHVKNSRGQKKPPLIEIILQTANFERVYTVKYTVVSIHGPFRLTRRPERWRRDDRNCTVLNL